MRSRKRRAEVDLPAIRGGTNGKRVDLAVRVEKRDPDLFAAVLEHEDLLDLGHRVQLCGAVDPGVQHGPDPLRRQRGERRRSGRW